MGGLHRLPGARLPEEYLAQARTHMHRAARERMRGPRAPEQAKRPARQRARAFAAHRINAFYHSLCAALRELEDTYALHLRKLHAFEAVVADLTIKHRALESGKKQGCKAVEDIARDVRALRIAVHRVGTHFAHVAATSASAIDANETVETAISELHDMMHSHAHVLRNVAELHRALRGIPVVNPEVPIAVLVGAPNVGKSSIVRAISSGTPEVNNYEFTTRGLTIGHLEDPQNLCRYQIMDSPGLLNRPDEERNVMEALTLSSMSDLPTAVVFVMDASGMCGERMPLPAQLQVRNTLRARFPHRPWIDVLAKTDLPVSPTAFPSPQDEHDWRQQWQCSEEDHTPTVDMHKFLQLPDGTLQVSVVRSMQDNNLHALQRRLVAQLRVLHRVLHVGDTLDITSSTSAT